MIQNQRYSESEEVTANIADCREGRGRRLEQTTMRMKQSAFLRIRWRASVR
jgi:hypothetical protein